jgi:hypothetical protein
MKRLVSLILTVALTVLLFGTALPVFAATGNVAVSVNSSKVTVGGTVTMTVKYSADANIGSLEAVLTYDAAVLEYVSATGVAANGGAGTVKVSWYETTPNPTKTRSFTVNFKAKAAGSTAISLATAELSDWDFNPLGAPAGKTTVNVNNPQKSSNANLTALRISSGVLTPNFSANVTEYKVTIPYDVSVFTVSTTTADKGATVAVQGSKNMQVGENTRVVKVTAPDGTVKSYTIRITRLKEGEEDPNDPSLKVAIGEEVRYVSADLSNVTLPAGFELVDLTIDEKPYPSAQNKSRSVVLLYLLDAKKENGAFYVYDVAAKTFSDFISATAPAGVYTLLSPSAAQIPAGFTQSFININEKTVAAFAFSNDQVKEYYLVYAASPEGNIGFYCYDTKEGTFQRYSESLFGAAQQVMDPAPEDLEQEGSFFGGIVKWFQNAITGLGVLRFWLIVAGGVILVAALVVLIVLLAKRPKSYKH